MTTLDPTVVDVAASMRQERLAEQVGELRGRRSLSSDRWMLLVGGLLLPLGIVLVLLGWWGASHTVFVFEQVPYLLSGGVLGLALVIAGGFVYFAYWLTLMVRESRLGRAELTAALNRVERLLEEGAAPRTARTAGAPSGRLVATRTGTMVHRTVWVAFDGMADLREVTAQTPGLTPCKLCVPYG
jgi:hypothetical protein